MTPKDRTRVLTFDDDAHKDIAAGVEIMRKAVGSTYGPGGRNVLIKKKYVAPILTRDGVTVARDIAGHGNKLPNQNATEAAKLVYQASEKTNKTAGDGTTATVVLLAALYRLGYRLITSGVDAMVVKRMLDTARDSILKFVESKSKTCTEAMLTQVAEISCGDHALAEMISDLVWSVGAGGAITINYHNAPQVEREDVTGYLFSQGFRNIAQEIELEDPLVFVTQKSVRTRADIIPFLEMAVREKRQFVIIGDVAGAALETLLTALSKQSVEGFPIIPPAFGADGHDYFEDIATYTGAHLIMEADNFSFLDSMKSEQICGSVKSVRVSPTRAVLFGDDKHDDAVMKRIALIKEQQLGSDITPSQAETLEQRYAKLAGKISIIKVGAATEVEREELFFRVEDAVEACKSALSSGIVAGGATTLLFASVEQSQKVDSKLYEDAFPQFVREALQAPFRLLMSNAAEDGGYFLHETLKAGYGKGYNLRAMSDKPEDLYKAGIVDPTKVITQVVRNAFSVAGALLTTGTILTELDDEPTQQN